MDAKHHILSIIRNAGMGAVFGYVFTYLAAYTHELPRTMQQYAHSQGIAGGAIKANVNFKKEQILSPTESPLWGRIQVFNEKGVLVAANISYVPSGTMVYEFTTVGFNGYPDSGFTHQDPADSEYWWHTWYIDPWYSPYVFKDYGIDQGTYTI